MVKLTSESAEDIITYFVDNFEGGSPARKYQAVAHLTLAVQAKDTIIAVKDAIIAQQNYRIALLTCRQLLERMAQYIIDIHAKRPESCKQKRINDPTTALKHLTGCKAIDTNLLQMIMQFSGDAEAQTTTASALYASTSNFIHNDRQIAEQILVLPAALHSSEIHLMTGIAMFHRLDVKVITEKGEDVTDKYLSGAQRQALNDRIKEAKNWVPKKEVIHAETPELAEIFAAAKLAREEYDDDDDDE